MNKILGRNIVLVLFAVIAFCSCNKQVSKRVTLWRSDKIPYGTYYAYQNLRYIFPDAIIQTSAKSPYTFYDEQDSSSAYIIIAYNVQPDQNELTAMLNYAMSGNHVFISAIKFGENLLDSFDLQATNSSAYLLRNDSLSLKITDQRNYSSAVFSYPGYSLANHFTAMDSSVTQILGRDENGNANYVRFRYRGGGAVYFHLAPAAFTNYFLLHKNNKEYYDLALSRIPDTISLVRWDDYFRHHSKGQNNTERSAFSKLGTFLNDEVLRWAFWLTIILFAIVYLVESKRKQRAIPTIKKLNNSSLDFVKTVGRLYYQQKDNKNLARKIASHLLAHIRSRYNLQTSQLNEAFEEKLAYKSGRPREEVNELVDEIRSIEIMFDMSDEELLAFNDKIDKFIYKP